MIKTTKMIAIIGFVLMSSMAQADGGKTDKMNAGDAPTMGLVPSGIIMPWGIPAETHGTWGIPMEAGAAWSIFDPFLLDIPGGGKGIPVHDAKDSSKIIGYVKMPARQKPAGPVHCVIKQKALLAKTVSDCEAAGGTVAK